MITNLQERRDKVIIAVITTFMETGEPVSSAYVSAKCGLGLSPASIRSIMKELEEDGFLLQPHASAGRVPTVRSYRYYVKHLMPHIDLTDAELKAVKQLAAEIEREADADMFINHVASVLSQVTELIGVAMSPSFERGIFDRIDIVNLGGSRFLLVISLKSGIVNTIHITLDKVIPRRKVEETARILTNRLHGLTISEIKKSIGKRLKSVSGGDRRLVDMILNRSDLIFSFSEDRNIHVSGLSRVLAHPDFEPVDHHLKLVGIFENKKEIAEVLKTTIMNEDDITIHIGGSGLWGSIPPLSMVSAMYRSEGNVGFLGVIGPARIHYPKLSAIVRYTASVTSHFFAS